jgi:hypothetical protein
MAKLMTIPGPPTSLNEGRHSCYIEPASLVEVMFDQLAWLLEHGNASCSKECPHCARLEKVKDLLLVPFQVPTEPLAGPRSHCCMKANDQRAELVSRVSAP